MDKRHSTRRTPIPTIIPSSYYQSPEFEIEVPGHIITPKEYLNVRPGTKVELGHRKARDALAELSPHDLPYRYIVVQDDAELIITPGTYDAGMLYIMVKGDGKMTIQPGNTISILRIRTLDSSTLTVNDVDACIISVHAEETSTVTLNNCSTSIFTRDISPTATLIENPVVVAN